MSNRKALLTGATGFVGLNLAEALTREGWEVTALHRATSDLTFLKRFPVKLAVGSTNDQAALEMALGEGTDTLFHVAGNTNLWRGRNAEQTRDNVEGTRVVAEAALARRVRRLIVTSSVAAWGPVQGEVNEETPMRGGRSWINYQRSKFEAERVAQQAIPRGLEVVIMNPCSIMGPYDIGTWSRMFSMIKNNKLPGVPPGSRSFAHVREVARAHIVAADKGTVGANYLLGGTNASMLEMVQLMCRLMNKREPSRVTPAWLLKIVAWVSQFFAERAGRIPHMTPETAALVSSSYTCSSQKARRELGYQTVPLETMVKDAFDWVVAEGRL